MKPTTATSIQNRQVWANIPVNELERTRDFYTDLGFKINGERNNEQLVSFFVGKDDFVVHFFLEEVFEHFSGGKAANREKGNEIMFTIGANSREEVNTWAERVLEAGGTLFAEPADIGNGWYNCGFADPEGHKWNVFYNGK
ncbi:MAG: VOC family protein [Balneolales bacterium]|nr:VOC family protein [Balneolales bacterium]